MPKTKSKIKTSLTDDNLITTVKKNLQNPTKKTFLTILIIGLVLLAVYKKNWLVAATVNGTPITGAELMMKMNQQFRNQTLQQLINEKIILSEVRKNNVNVTQAEVTQKISELEKNVGGAQALDTLLGQQGQTRDFLKQQLVTQLSIEKLYSKDATVSATEVANFIAQNKDQLQASDSAGQTKEATDIIKQQKLSKIFNDKFQNLKQSAKVIIF